MVVVVMEVDWEGVGVPTAKSTLTFTLSPHQPTDLIRQTSSCGDLHLWTPVHSSLHLNLALDHMKLRNRSCVSAQEEEVHPLGWLSFMLRVMMQYESNAIIPHDPILVNHRMKVDPQASPSAYVFFFSIKQAQQLHIVSSVVLKLFNQRSCIHEILLFFLNLDRCRLKSRQCILLL